MIRPLLSELADAAREITARDVLELAAVAAFVAVVAIIAIAAAPVPLPV